MVFSSAMAINISMMFGRIGSVMGTNIVGFALDNYCNETFGLSAGIMSACGVLAFFIPKIRRVDGESKDKKLDHKLWTLLCVLYKLIFN